MAPQQWREPREALVKHHKRISQRRWRLNRRREEKGRGMRHELHDSAPFLIRNKSRRQISRGTLKPFGLRTYCALTNDPAHFSEIATHCLKFFDDLLKY